MEFKRHLRLVKKNEEVKPVKEKVVLTKEQLDKRKFFQKRAERPLKQKPFKCLSGLKKAA